MNTIDKINIVLNKITVVQAVIITVLSYFFGPHWFLFVIFFTLNVIDYISGIIRSKIRKTESSAKGLMGILKKLGYWIMVAVGFGLSAVFVYIGKELGFNLAFTSMIGYFTLVTLIINEFRSILENLVEAGYKLPPILIKGLEAADKIIEDQLDMSHDQNDEEKE